MFLPHALPELDDTCLSRVLDFVNIPSVRLCCRSWADRLYLSLQLKHHISFVKAVSGAPLGDLSYHHSSVYDFGGMEECVSFSFTFSSSRFYSMLWFREGLTTDNEQQYGKWKVVADHVECETLDPVSEVNERHLRHADACRVFTIPVAAVLAGRTTTNQCTSNWERAARGLQSSNIVGSLEPSDEQSQGEEIRNDSYNFSSRVPAVDARYVDVDGEIVQVSLDIIQNWPESDWSRLMRCRIRFGTGSERWA